jgi:hypothetical protein
MDIEMAVDLIKLAPSGNSHTIKLKPGFIYKPDDHQGGLIPDEYAEYYVYDRVVNVASNTPVPFGLRGTVTGILGDGSDNKTLYEILFDKQFPGAVKLRSSSLRCYFLHPSCLINLSYGKRKSTNYVRNSHESDWSTSPKQSVYSGSNYKKSANSVKHSNVDSHYKNAKKHSNSQDRAQPTQSLFNKHTSTKILAANTVSTTSITTTASSFAPGMKF